MKMKLWEVTIRNPDIIGVPKKYYVLASSLETAVQKAEARDEKDHDDKGRLTESVELIDVEPIL